MLLRELYSEYATAMDDGDPAALQAYCEILMQTEPKKARDPHRLYLSDIGACPRKVMYRITGAEKHTIGAVERENQAVMFELGNHMERVLAGAFLWKGIDFKYQFGLAVPRDNWGGRGDLCAPMSEGHCTVGGLWTIIECKSSHPGAFKWDRTPEPWNPITVEKLPANGLPYKTHAYQGTSYQMFAPAGLVEAPAPVIFQVDRGGENTARQWHLAYSLVLDLIPTITTLMDELDYWRNVAIAGEGLPPVLPKVIRERDKKRGEPWYQSLKYEPDPRCTYCDYSRTYDGSGPCECNTGIEKWGSRKSPGDWDFTSLANIELVAEHYQGVVHG